MSLESMRHRMEFIGGATSDGRYVRNKYLSFVAATNNAYQAETITFNGNKYRCLINPDRLDMDYDQKEISIDFKANMQIGNTFYWDRTDSHWIVYLQRLEEEAYFRGRTRRCNQEIEINDNRYWVYVRGPQEKDIAGYEQHGITSNELNYSLMMYIQKNEETTEYFKRFKKIKLDGHNWQVVAVDRYSQSAMLEVYFKEDHDNPLEDAEIPVEPIKPDTTIPYIEGPQEIRAFDYGVEYSISGLTNGTFSVDNSKIEIVSQDGTSCIINVNSGRSTKFNLEYSSPDGTAALEVIVKSL